MSSSTAPAAPSATSSGAAELKAPPNLKVVGIILAITSGLLIGSSFVFKKKGLLRSQAGAAAGEGVAYLKSPLWWLGMTMMILGELCNFAAYAFVEALVVTPLGALSVVICAILSSFFLNEKLSLFGWLGCVLCILGSTIIALNSPQEQSIGQIREFQKLFLAPGFLAYAGTLIAISLVVIFWFAPKYGSKNMMWYISVCSLIGGISVSVTTGLGSAIVTSVQGNNQFNYWFTYFLLVFVATTLITEVFYLNKALALFNTAMVTPTYYVMFTFCSMVTTVVLFQGLKASVAQILTLVLAFFSICIGITILQMSKIDPEQLSSKLDRRSTMLLQAARSQTQTVDEKELTGVEDPGIDALRGSFGAVGSMIRARSARRLSQASRNSTMRARHTGAGAASDAEMGHYGGMRRHQLFDNPVPALPDMFRAPGPPSSAGGSSAPGTPRTARQPTIKFGDQDLVHSYAPPGTASSAALHEFQTAGRAAHARGLGRADGEGSPGPAVPGALGMAGMEDRASTAATIGVGARYSNFLSLTSPPSDAASFVTSPEPVDAGGPRTAPAQASAFQHRAAHDPFERTPATAGAAPGAGFPGSADSGSSGMSSIADVFAPEAADEEAQHVAAAKHRALFGRTPSPRRYPGVTAAEAERGEEAARLWRRGSDDVSVDSLPDGAAAPVAPGSRTASPGGIRLVGGSPATSRDRY